MKRGGAVAVIPGRGGAPIEVGANLGWLYLDQGHLDEARAVFEAVLGTDPGNVGAREGLETAGRLEEEAALTGAPPGTADSVERRIAALKRYLENLSRRGTAQA